MISSSVASSLPNFILFLILSENRKASCGTAPIDSLRLVRSKCFIGSPSIKISPDVVSYSRATKSKMVDLPDPVLPRIAVVSPSLMVNVKLLNAVISVSSYLKPTFTSNLLIVSWSVF